MNEILKIVNTSWEREALFNFLESLEAKIFDPNLNFVEFVNSNLEDKFKSNVISYFDATDTSQKAEHVLLKLKELRDGLKKMPKVVLTVTIDPDSNTIDMVKKTLNDTTDEPVIIEFVKDLSIIGGASVEKDGYIFEHSFRNYFEKRKGANSGVLEELKEVKNGF